MSGNANVLIDALSQPLMRGLVTNAQGEFSSLTVRTTPPTPDQDTRVDGVWPFGQGGITSPQRLFLLPFAEGSAGSQFSVRVYGWREAFSPPDQGKGVWIPYLIVELLCTASNIAGPTSPDRYILDDAEHLCDTITLTQGSLGPTGLINSTGPGSDLVAYAILELTACRFFQFDFGQGDPVPMNTLWARGP